MGKGQASGVVSYIVAPVARARIHSAHSRGSRSWSSRPEAVSRKLAKMRALTSATVLSPSMMVPQLMSMSSCWRFHKAVLVDSFNDGAGAQPYAEPRPVVKQIRLAPPAARCAAGVVARRIHENQAMGKGPVARMTAWGGGATFGDSAQDFSKIVVRPPALLPCDGCCPWRRSGLDIRFPPANPFDQMLGYPGFGHAGSRGVPRHRFPASRSRSPCRHGPPGGRRQSPRRGWR